MLFKQQYTHSAFCFTMERLTSLWFIAGVRIEWKTHSSPGSCIFLQEQSHKCSKCYENRPLAERMRTWCVKGVHTPLSAPVIQSPQWQYQQLVSGSTQSCTPCGKWFTLASYQWVGPPLLLAPLQDLGATQRLVLPTLKYILRTPLLSNPVVQPMQSKLITHIILTDDFPS